MADKGSSTAKISLVANFEQNNIKAMGKQLSDGIKTSLKDIKLDTVFDDADILGGVKKEIESIDGLLKNRTLNRLDFSSMIPPLAQALEDNSLSEQIRLQIIQGFREGLESGRTFLQGMPSGMTGDEIKAQFRQSAIMSDAVDSMPGLNKSIFKKMWKEITPQDIRQAMATMDTYDNEEDLRKYMDYLTDAETAIQTILDNIGYETKGSSQKTAMAYGRLQYLAGEDSSGKIRKILEKLNNSVVGPSKHTYKDENGEIRNRGDRNYVGKQIKDVIQEMQIDDEGLSGLIEDVQLISSIRDDYFSRISESDATIENLLAKTLQRGYKNGSLQKMEPLYTGNYKTPAHITLSDLIEASNRETNTGGGEGAENAAKRAENAAERAENASEEAHAVAEDMKGTVEEGTAEASGTSKKSKKKPSTQTSAEPAEQIADDAEADAENAEHVADALDDKKARLENTIAELENKKRELQELNDKYQKAISDTFGDVKTPEEALALFKEKATQLQQADKDFADIIPQRNFTDPSNSEEIAILEEYEKRLAALQQALVEYQKAGETAMDKGVNLADIRANQVDEERLQLNFADSTIDGYIKGLQKAIEDNKKKISEYENLLKTYRGQLEEFSRQGSPSDTKPNGGRQAQSRPAADTAREETGEVRKSREELQAERKKLEAEIQNSTQLMSGVEGQIANIDTKIVQVQESHQHNETKISQLTEKKEQIESQIQQTKDELKTIKERLQDAVDAKQAAEEEIRALEEKLSNADGSDIISADTPRNAERYKELKEQRDYADFELNSINQPILDDLLQERQSLEDALNRSYSVKTMDEAYKQAMQRKEEYLKKSKKYAEAVDETEKYEIGSADWMMKLSGQQKISAEQDAAWMAYYKSMQEFESHGRGETTSKRSKREKLYAGVPSLEMPIEENAEVVLSNLQNYLDRLNKQISDRKKLVDLSQKELDELQQKIDELSSHVVTVDDISKQLEQKRQEQQKFEQEEANWAAQQDTKQAELDDLNERLNGTRGVTNYLKAVQDGQQHNQEELAQLQQQRAEQQRIYDEAKAIQEEKQQQLAEIDRMITEAESREQQAPAVTPAATQEKPSAPVSSGQAGEESPVVQNLEQQIKEVETTIKATEVKQKELLARKEKLNKLLGEYGQEASGLFYLTDDTEETSQYWQKAGNATKDPATGAAKQLREKGQIFKDTIDAIKEQKKLLNSLDKESDEYQQAEQKLQQLKDKKSRDWLAFYRAHEQLDYWVGKEEGNTRAKQTLNKWTPERMGLENLGFSQENLDKMIADVKGQAERLAQMRADVAAYQEQYNQLQEQINTLNTKRDNLIAESQRSKPAETEPPQGTSAETLLSSSGSQTASGVQEEGNEAGDAAEKMQALAQAKKEALEANQKLAESANTTQKAIQNESDAGNFDELIAKLVEAAKLLAQLPQSFEGFKGFDLEPLKTLSEAIQQLPKEGLSISLGDDFNNLANSIDKVLNKVQELTSEAKIAEIEGNITQKYDEQIKQLKADAEEAKRVIEELKRTKQDVVRDEYDPRLDSSSEQYAPKEVGREIAARAKRNPDTDVDALIKEYGNLKRAQEKLFTIDSVDEYSAALEKREEILQRILELEQKVALSDVGQAQIDNLLMGYGEDASPSFSALDAARNAAQKSSVGRLSKNYTDQQKAEIKAMSDSLSSINIIPKDVQSNWSKKRREEYNQIAEGAQTASQAIETLNANLAAMEANGANPTVLKTFLQLKESTAQMIKDTQDKNNVFGESVEAASTKLLDRLSNVETRLQVIKRDSGKLINVDPALAGALETIEKHLNKIQDLKNTVSNDPLQAINPQFTRSANSYLAQMEGKGKSKSVVEGLEQVSDRSQTNFNRMTTNYGKYASALKKLFDDISKGASASLTNLEEDLARVDELATRLTGSTGLERNSLLTGELNSKAAPQVVDAQTEAASKASIAYESMLTKIESKAESAQSKISNIFGTDGITEGLKSNFVEGMAKGFDDFVNSANQAGTALQHLQEIQSNIRDDKTWLTQKENIIDYQQTMDTLESSLKKVTENAGNFKIVDDLDVQKLRASTTQFIKDNPALSGSDISQFKGYIDQLQGKINSVDFKNIEDGIQRVKQNAIEAGRTGDTFMSMLTQRFKSLGAYLLSFVSFYEVIGVFKEGIGIIHELDDALTEMQKVSDESLSSLKEYQKNTFDTANNIGTTAAQLQTSTADWMRLGETLQEASQSAQTANILFNVSEFDNINDATTALVAMSAAYEDAEKGIDKMDIVDRLNLIGNNYAIATDELATALQDGAATLTTAGNDLDEAIALTTAGNLITQDASKTGKGIRTIALRLTGTKEAAEELEEMGEDTSDMIMSQSKMRELIMNATKVASNNYQGFDIQDELGRYKSTYEIMLGLSQIWDEIRQADLKSGDNRQNLLLESIAGKNRASIASSILQNPKTLQSVYEDSSTKAAGSAMEENQKYLDSISGHLAKLQNAWQELWANAANRDVINMFIDLGTTILNVINEIGGLQSAFALLYGGTIIKGLMTADSWLVKFVSRLDEAKATSKSLGDVFRTIFDSNKSDNEDKSIFKGWAQIQNQRENRAKAKENPEIQALKEQKEAQQEMNDVLEEGNALKEESISVSGEKAAAEVAETTAENANNSAHIEGAVGETTDSVATADNTKKTEENTLATIANKEAEDAQTGSKLSGGMSQGFDGAATGAGSAGTAAGATGLVGLASSPLFWLVAIPAAITIINGLFNYLDQQQQDHIDKAHELTNTWNENKDSLNNYTQQYQDLHKQLENTNLSEEEQANIKKQLYDLQKQITDEYGHSADGVDLVNGKLDEQLDKLRNIKAEEARSNLAHNAGDYENAEKKLTKDRQVYNMSSGGFLSDKDIESLTKDLTGNWGKYDYAGEIGIRFTGNALEAEESMDVLYNRLLELKEEMGEDWDGSGFEGLMNSLTASIQENDEIISKYKDDYNSFLEQSIFAKNGTFGEDNLSAGEVLVEAQEAVDNYNAALVSGDTSQIEKTKTAFDKVKEAANEVVDAMGDQKFIRPFEDIFDKVDQTQIEAYNIKKKIDDSKVKNAVESVLGTPKENKKSAKEIPDTLRDAVENLLNEQQKAYEWGMKGFGVEPLQGLYPTAQFGNVNMNERPEIKWDKKTKKQYADALKSWNYNPEKGSIDTVYGMSEKFNNIDIAFTPIMKNSKNGKGEFLDADTVHDYIQNIINEATDKTTGKIDLGQILELDKPEKGGKGIIAAVNDIGDYTANAVGKMMHFSGKKGAIYLGMEQLSKAAKEAGLDVNNVMEALQKTGSVDALSGLFDDFKYDVTDIEGYLSNLSNLPPEVASDIQTIADAFGITADSSQESINAVAELLGRLGYIATTSLDEAGESFDKFAQKASGWIEETSNLSSTLSKGQGFLTFTKTQDDQGHEIASEVKAIADAYKDLPNYDYASLFEETAGGIMVNADALRALQSQEESMRHAEFYEKRQELMEKFTASSGAVADAYREEIEQLDMLWSAYSGATSALSKYQNGHGSADYSTNYKLFRDQIFKEGDAYLESGETGEEGFRRIAQLFSYKDLALASVKEVEAAYEQGADTMQKFFTEDPTQGANLWIDEIMSWPEEYAEISTNAAGETVMTMTDKNLDAVAEHYGVSKDLILSLMNELNATGSRVHFFTDGQMQQLDKVTEQAEAAKQRLIDLKKTGTDPALAHANLFDFDVATLSAEELESKIKEIQDLKANPDISTETASALDDLLQSMIERLDIINGKHVEPDMEINVDTLDYAKEITGDLNERLDSIKENSKLGFDISIKDDKKIQEFAQQFSQLPEKIQMAYDFTPTNDPEEIIKQIENKYANGVEIKISPVLDNSHIQGYYKDGHTPIGADLITVGVGVDPASVENAKQQAEQGISQAQPEMNIHGEVTGEDKPLIQQMAAGALSTLSGLFTVTAEASEVEKVKEEAEQPIETDVHFKPENSVQDAAQQGVQTTNHETTIKDEQINTTVTSDTSQVDAANQTVSNLKAMSGSNVSIGLSVDGIEDVDKAKDSIDNLTSQKNPKVKVTINGNSAQFNKTSSDVTNKLNALGKKVTTPKISADNSRLSSKVSDSKSKLSSIKDKTARITASQTGFSTISSWKSSVYDKLQNKNIYIKAHYSSSGSTKQPPINGSAHAIGTTVSHGRAFANGSFRGQWGLPQDEKGSLVNEIGPELVVNARTGQWQILNGGYPTFANFKKGDIIFNANQTESLLKNGYIKGSYAKLKGNAFANGTVDDEDFDEDELEGKAFATGTAKWDGQLSGMSHAAGGTLRKASKKSRKGSTSSSSSSKKSSGSGKKSSGKSGKKSSGNSSSNKSSKDNLQTLDAIEIRLNRIDALISQLDTNAGKTYSTFANRNSALVQDLATVQKEINAINSSLSSKSHVYNYLSKASAAAKEAGLKSGDEGYKKGSQGASGTALSDKWIKRIQNSVNSGQYFTINDVRDEGLWKKIQAYQTWYEKYVKMQQKLQDQINKLSQLTIQQLTLIQTKWETTINNIGANITSLQNRIDLVTERGYDVAENYYSSQITENQNKIKALTSEASELQAQLNAAVKAGRIQQYSEEWYKWYIQIKNINNEVIAVNKEIQSLVNSIRQLRWDKFERGQDELSNLADEMEFLGDLINEIDLFDKDTGLVTDKGKAAFALEAQRYDIYIKQAKKYGEAVKRLNADIAKDPNNKTLIDQRNEWLKAQQDAISNAHSQKEAIADLVEKGIKKQIEAMEDLIDKYEDTLDAEKEQQKYAESIAKKQKEINSLQKQLKSMEGDDSEEGATKRQKLRDQLKEAQKDLEDTQEDQRISDIKDALSAMQEKYEEVLNARLDNIDALLTEVVSGVNQSGADIVSTLRDVASSVDYSLSGSLNNIYTGVQNLSANVANVAGQVGALVTATSTSNGSVNNASATTYAKTPTPTVPTTPTVADYTPKPTASSSTGSGSTAAKSTTTPAKTTAKAKNGLITEGGQTYYYKNDKKQTGWQTVGGKKYYFSTKNGAMLKDVQKIGNTYYLLDKTTGALKSTYTGLYKTGSSTYYFKSGAIQTGWRDMKEGRRYFSVNSGKMLTGKQKIGNDEYYFNSNGILQIGKFNVDGYTFETDKNGKIKKRTKAAGGKNALKGSSNNSKKAVSTAASKGLKIQGGFAKGTKNVNRAGMYRVDEEGQEVFINKNGKIYTRLDKGTAVLPHDAAVNLLKGMSNPVDFIASHMDMRPNKNITNTNNTTGDIVNNITFNIPNVTNYKEFMQEAQRDPNFTKYIQELSIGRLNGNNSLKGNSIRFR